MSQPKRIGEYQVLEKIGEGTFGVVYRCRKQVSGEIRALKVCNVSDLDSISRFAREADIATRLEHKNIVRVFGFGISDLGPYLTQDCLEGEDLSAKIASREPLSLMQRFGYLLQIAQAMVYAHGKGIVHQDLKPGNIRVLADDQIKIMDFGIAQLAHSEERIAKLGSILGTAGYLSPEQVLGRPTDERADIFSFGALAYHLLCYEAPFPGEDLSEVLRGVLRLEPLPLVRHWEECPAALSNLILRCLEKDPDDRYSRFDEVLGDLTGLTAALHSVPAGGIAGPANSAVPEREVLNGTVPLDSGPNALHRRLMRAARSLLDGSFFLRWGVAVTGMLIMGGVWWLAGDPSRGDSALAQTAAVLPGPVVEPPTRRGPAGGQEGSLLVVAAPWGEVVSVTDTDGVVVSLPSERVTPLTLSLPAGHYRVELTNPHAENGRFCYVAIEGAGTATCQVQFINLTATDYFKEAGWWR